MNTANDNHSKVLLLIVILLLCAGSATFAQKQYNIWAFGDAAGINFNGSSPQLFKSKIEGVKAPLYTSSICDADGDLLFYTDGFTCWNSLNTPIPKYQNRWPWSGFIMPLICPYPDNDSLYYVFGVSDFSYAHRLQYLTINMNVNGGRGAIVYPMPSTLSNYFTVLVNNASTVLAGTVHCNQKDKWIVTQADGAFYAYLVTKDGVNASPVVSPFTNVLPPGFLNTGTSNIKFSANGEKMIVPLVAENKVLVLDFNNQTGSFDQPLLLPVPEGKRLEEVEISPDGSKLYLAYYGPDVDDPDNDVHNIAQMDLNAGSALQVENSLYSFGVRERELCTPHFCYILQRSMQLAPDGKIYISIHYSSNGKMPTDTYASTIDEPNKKGRDARYHGASTNLKRIFKFINYNYIRSGSYTLRDNGIQVQKKTCADQPVSFSLLYTRIDSVRWDFGDAASGSRNFSTALQPQHTYPAPGLYTVKALIYKRCFADTAIKVVAVTPDKSVQAPAFIKDTTVCIGEELVLNALSPSASSYTWDNGLIYPIRTIKEAGKYAITVSNSCSIAEKSFTVAFEACPCTAFVPSAFTPNGDGLNDEFKPVLQCGARDYRFKIYNRYGGVVFESTQVGKGWSGRLRSEWAPAGVYVWTLAYRNPNNQQQVVKNGTVVLVR